MINEVTLLHGWESFYVIVGSSAGALIGLQFVVITLIAEIPLSRSDAQVGPAFATPSVVHFAVVVLISAVLSAPWQGIGNVAILWALVGHGGIVYVFIVTRRMRKQTAYKPVLEDWLFHVLLPLVAYAMLAVSAYAAHSYERGVLFFVGASALLLLFIGIHNAWDAVTYHVFVRRRGKPNDGDS
jgi:nucleoside recognition membrane protein YjiH